MPGGSSGEKTEKATPKRKRDERKKGNVFLSKDLVSAFSLLILFFSIKVFSEFMYVNIVNNMMFWFKSFGEFTELSEETIKNIFINTAKTILFVAGPITLVGMAVPIVFSGIQTRFIFTISSLKPKLSRLNPISGMKKLISLRSIVELVKNLLKIAVIASIMYNSIEKRIVKIASLSDVDIKTAIIFTASSIFSIVMSVSLVFIFLGIADLFYQWWEYEKNLRMTKQEVKEEYKQMEGDPQIKAQIRQKQRAMSQARMMQDVPKADVVIRNPTHFAVAIKYDPDKNRAPVVVAKGADRIAFKIIEIAEENNVICTENKPLARGLYDAVDIGREVPEEFYHEVAEVLAFVYDLKNKKLSH